MLAKFEDIRDRIKEEPSWYDSNGTPRYGRFHPNMSPNIYASEVALVKIRCSNCLQEFLVEFNWSKNNLVFNEESKPLSEWIKSKRIHYGDPPRHNVREDGSGCVGETMNCDDIEVVEFWKQEGRMLEWVRKKEFEINVENELM